MTGPPQKLLTFRRPCSTQLHTLTETVEAAYGAVVFALCQQYRVSCHKKRHYWNSELTSCLLAYPMAHLGYSPPARARACGGTGTANTINLANSSFTDVDLDCTVSKESWCLLLVKNHLISQAKTFTGEQVFWGLRVWPSCLHGMSQSIYWLYVWPLFQASRNAIVHICIRLFQLPPCRKRKWAKKKKLDWNAICVLSSVAKERARADLYFSIFPRELESRSSLEK